MKKDIALLLGLVLGLGFVSCSSDDDDDEYTNGEGKYLAEEIRTRYDWKDGKRSSEGKTYSIYRYDEKGQTVCAEFLYDGNWRYEHVYDENGRDIETTHYDSDKLSYKLISEYNSFGEVSVSYKYNENGRLWETIGYEYDNNGREIKETNTYHYVDGTKKTGTILTYGYGEKADTTYLYYPNNGGFDRKSISEYDSHHNIVKITNIYANGDTDVLEYIHEYDSKGRTTKLVGPIFAEGVNPTKCASTQYLDISYNEDGSFHIMHYKIPAKNEEYDLECSYKYKKK